MRGNFLKPLLFLDLFFLRSSLRLRDREERGGSSGGQYWRSISSASALYSSRYLREASVFFISSSKRWACHSLSVSKSRGYSWKDMFGDFWISIFCENLKLCALCWTSCSSRSAIFSEEDSNPCICLLTTASLTNPLKRLPVHWKIFCTRITHGRLIGQTRKVCLMVINGEPG